MIRASGVDAHAGEGTGGEDSARATGTFPSPGDTPPPTAVATEGAARDVAPRTGFPQFDLGLLANPQADERARRAEWRRFFDHYHERLDRHWRASLPNAALREEFLQDVWSKLLPELGRIDAPGKVWNWLLTASRRHWIDLGRRATSHRRALEHARLDSEAERHSESAAATPLDRLAHDAFDGWRTLDPTLVRERIAALSPLEREIIALRSEGHEHADITTRLGLRSVEACRQRWSEIVRSVRHGSGVGR